MQRTLFGRFDLQGLIGEGEFSYCHRAMDRVTGQAVAVKQYKPARPQETQLRFQRQTQILQELREPFARTRDHRLWNEDLEKAKVEELCLQMVMCSSPNDLHLYTVLEIARCNLGQWLGEQPVLPVPRQQIQEICYSLVKGTAGLHAKGLVHLDIKPENFMQFGNQWKLIDVEGCIHSGKGVAFGSPTVAFSPSYCAPEFARCILTQKPVIGVTFELDIWSLGMTMAEFATTNSPLKQMHNQCERQGRTFQQASKVVLNWVANTMVAPIFQTGGDSQFEDLLYKWMIVPDASQRKQLAECMGHEFFPNSISSCRSPSPSRKRASPKPTPSLAGIPEFQKSESGAQGGSLTLPARVSSRDPTPQAAGVTQTQSGYISTSVRPMSPRNLHIAAASGSTSHRPTPRGPASHVHQPQVSTKSFIPASAGPSYQPPHVHSFAGSEPGQSFTMKTSEGFRFPSAQASGIRGQLTTAPTRSMAPQVHGRAMSQSFGPSGIGSSALPFRR